MAEASSRGERVRSEQGGTPRPPGESFMKSRDAALRPFAASLLEGGRTHEASYMVRAKRRS